MLARLKFKIDALVNEMLDQLPDEVWSNPEITFLDPAMAGGQFLKEVISRLRKANHSDENIASRIFGVAEDEIDLNYARKTAKLIGKYGVGGYDFDYEKEFSMKKFDVIVGNPPYQDSAASGNSLWSKFILTGFNTLNKGGHFMMVVPGRWVLPGMNIKEGQIRIMDYIFKKVNLKLINLGECSKHFKVGSDPDYFSYFYIKNNNYEGKTTLITKKSNIEFDLSEVNWLPYKNADINSINIIKKISKIKTETFHLSWKYERNHNISDKLSKSNPYTIFLGKNNIKYSDFKSELYDTNKVIFKLGRFISYEDRIFIDYKGSMGYNSAYIIPLNKNENVDYLNSKLYRFIAKCLFNGSEITAEGYRTLPKLDSSRIWTDKEIYDHFGLTQEEIDYIEATVK